MRNGTKIRKQTKLTIAIILVLLLSFGSFASAVEDDAVVNENMEQAELFDIEAMNNAENQGSQGQASGQGPQGEYGPQEAQRETGQKGPKGESGEEGPFIETWDGRGTDSLDCRKAGDGERPDKETGWIHWVFSTKGDSTDAVLTLGGTGSGTYAPGEPLNANVWHFYTPYFELDGLTAEIELLGGAPGPGGGLVISDYCPGKTGEPDPEGSLKVIKTIDTRQGDPQAGVKFELFQWVDDDFGDKIAEDYTDENGEITFTNLKPGAYALLETQTGDFTLNTALSDEMTGIQVEADKTTKVHVVNDSPPSNGGGGGGSTGGGGGSTGGRPGGSSSGGGTTVTTTQTTPPLSAPPVVAPEVITSVPAPPMTIVLDEAIPLAPPVLPQTGEASPLAMILSGLGVSLSGLAFGFRKKVKNSSVTTLFRNER